MHPYAGPLYVRRSERNRLGRHSESIERRLRQLDTTDTKWSGTPTRSRRRVAAMHQPQRRIPSPAAAPVGSSRSHVSPSGGQFGFRSPPRTCRWPMGVRVVSQRERDAHTRQFVNVVSFHCSCCSSAGLLIGGAPRVCLYMTLVPNAVSITFTKTAAYEDAAP